MKTCIECKWCRHKDREHKGVKRSWHVCGADPVEGQAMNTGIPCEDARGDPTHCGPAAHFYVPIAPYPIGGQNGR